MQLPNPQINTVLLALLSCTVACQEGGTHVQLSDNRVTDQNTHQPTRVAALPPPTTMREVTLDLGWKLAPKEFRDVNRRLKYSITGQFPVVTEARDSRAQRLTQEIRRSIARRYRYITAPNPKEFREHVLFSPK